MILLYEGKGEFIKPHLLGCLSPPMSCFFVMRTSVVMCSAFPALWIIGGSTVIFFFIATAIISVIWVLLFFFLEMLLKCTLPVLSLHVWRCHVVRSLQWLSHICAVLTWSSICTFFWFPFTTQGFTHTSLHCYGSAIFEFYFWIRLLIVIQVGSWALPYSTRALSFQMIPNGH